MKQFLSQRVEMQIPQGHEYGGLITMPQSDKKLHEFVKVNFEFPSNNLNEICNYIARDHELEKIIMDLPEIISKELDFTKVSLDFMKETDPSEKILEIVIYSNLDEKMQFQKEDIISDWIIDNYQKTTHEFIILVES